MLRLRDMIPIIGWIVAGLLLVTVVLGLVFVKNQNATFRANMDRLEYREGQMEQFFMEQRKENARIAKSDIDRENYIAYFSNVITEFYASRTSGRNNELTMAERRLLLGTIYDYAKGTGFPFADEFLPLAYLRVESEFYQYNSVGGRREYLTGTSGERSMFQFMPATAREIYRRHGRDFDPEWYKSFEECVWLWFNFNHELSFIFKDADEDDRIRWAAYSYNRGHYRNELVTYYLNGLTIERHLRDWPFRSQGDPNYNYHILRFYRQYRDGFRNEEG